jgi:glucose/arabinose dehydrogenase
MRSLVPVLALTSLAALACSDDGAGGPGGPGGKADDLSSCTPATQSIEAVRAFSDLAFERPVAMVQAPGTSRWYLAEQRGVIWTFTSDAAGTTASQPTVFADLRTSVNATSNEAGLLGIALSPSFAIDGRVYLSYTASSSSSPAGLKSQLSRVKSANGTTMTAGSLEVLFGVDQPFANHNGGHIEFGPDGMLFLTLGDGGSGGDPGNRSQNKSLPFGKILRFDVSGATGYAVPSDNPFAAGGGLPEIWAYGLRNAWKFSFDAPTGRMWAADVGQSKWEEIDLIVKGGNYGWNKREGAHCYPPTTTSCTTAGFIEPVAEYGRDEGISVTGGYVYRGAAIPALQGQYVFGDFGTGTIWALRETAAGELERRAIATGTGMNISSFAVSNGGEQFALDFATGGVFALSGTSCSGGQPQSDGPDAGTFDDDGPVTFAQVYQQVIVPECVGCHVASAAGGLAMPNATAGFAALVDVATQAGGPCAGKQRVVAGDPTSSVLFQKVTSFTCGSEMPPGGSISAAKKALIEQWIADGAMP